MVPNYTDLRTLEDGTHFRVINGECTGYVFSINDEKYVHVDATNREYKITGNEDLIIVLI